MGLFPLFPQQRVLPGSPSTTRSRLAAQTGSSGEEWLQAVPRSCPAWLPRDPGPAPSPVPGPGTSSPRSSALPNRGQLRGHRYRRVLPGPAARWWQGEAVGSGAVAGSHSCGGFSFFLFALPGAVRRQWWG